MSDYTKLPLWKMASALGREVHALTETAGNHDSTLRILREKAAALPLTIAMDTASALPRDRAGALRSAYELAHDIDYLLFFSLRFGLLPYRAVKSLLRSVYRLKQHLLASTQALPTTKG